MFGIDTANGATYKIAKEVFDSLGIRCEIINNTPNGVNINDKCGSTHFETISKYVVEHKLSMGVAYDGDGDRCFAVDENGALVDGDRLLAIFANYLKSKGELKNNTVVATVMSNLGLKKFAKENGMNLEQTKVGDRYVLEKMLENGYNLGGEQSGHIILLDYNPTGDGILTSVLLCLIVLQSGVKLSKLRECVNIYPQVLVNAKVDFDKKDRYSENEEICKEIEKIENEFKDNGRVLIRPSGTESLVRVMIEGEDQEYITSKANALAKLIEEKLK